MKKILQLTFAILLAKSTLIFGQEVTKINGPFEVKGNSGTPATSGTNQNRIASFSSNDTYGTLYLGNNLATPFGLWLQSSGRNDLSVNYPLLLNPNGGNVGIGTANPIAKLEVTSGTVRFSENWFPFSDGNNYHRALNHIFADNAANEKMRIVSTGSVGIGTSTPSALLDVNGMIRSIGVNVPTSGIGAEMYLNSGIAYFGGYNRSSGTATDVNVGFQQQLYLKNNGNIGIGNNTPETKLHITGDVTMGRADGSKWYFQTPSSDLRIVGAVPANLSLLPQGFVGIGTTIPTNTLTIDSKTTNSGLTLTGLKSTGTNVTQGSFRPIAVNDLGDVVLLGGATGAGDIWAKSGDNIYRSIGNVGIGTTTPKAKLDVNGDILTSITSSEELHSVAERATRHIGLKSGITADGFTGMKLNVSQSPKCGNRSSISFQTWGCGVSTSREIMTLNDEGNVGIGTTAPAYKLSVAGTIYSDNAMFDKELSLYGYGARVAAYGQNGDVSIAIKREVNTPSSWWIRTPNGSTDLDFFNGGTAMKIAGNGSVSIGTNIPVSTNYKLAVGGDIIAERVVVKLQTNWPDYVFTPSHYRATLPEVEKYINQNHHLPNVPSAQEVADKGIDVGAMNTKMMEKIEELTLYLIEQNKRNDEQNKKLEALEKKNAELEIAIKNIKK